MAHNSNLTVEQSLRDCNFTEDVPRIYSTGVHLVPMKISIQGTNKYVWIVDDFNDDSFDSEGNNISPKVMSDTIEQLQLQQKD
jgi:hypothetical protein